MTDLQSAKQDLRRRAAAGRRDAAAAAGERPAELLAGRGCEALAGLPAGAVSGFWPIRDEVDVRPLMAALRGFGWTVLLPVVTGPDSPLVFRVWAPGDALAAARFGVMEPAGGETLDPDVVLVPLLAFDRKGHRLGYGKGHYDRTLAELRGRRKVFAVGVAYAGQEVPVVPADRFDQKLDAVLTEREWIRCDGKV